MKVKSESEVAQWYMIVSDPMNRSLPGFLPGRKIHGIFQARVLEWGAIAFSVGPHILGLKMFLIYTPVLFFFPFIFISWRLITIL